MTKKYDACVMVDVGRPAYFRIDGKTVRTSTVQAANSDTGIVRTKNSLYVPKATTQKPYFHLT